MLVIVDTSVWVQHFRRGVPELVALLAGGDVVTHPVVIGELAVGGIRNRHQTLADLQSLLAADVCPFPRVLDFVEQHHLHGIGLSWGDVQVLAAAELNAIPLWTFDQTLGERARLLNLAWVPGGP